MHETGRTGATVAGCRLSWLSDCVFIEPVQVLQKNTRKAFNDVVHAGVSWSILCLNALVLSLATEKDLSHDDRDILPWIRYDSGLSCDTMNCSTHLSDA